MECKRVVTLPTYGGGAAGAAGDAGAGGAAGAVAAGAAGAGCGVAVASACDNLWQGFCQ